MFGIDYATPGADVPSLKRAGVKFVCRYLAPDMSMYQWKRVTAGEVKALRNAGIAVVLVYETSAARARAGAGAGEIDADQARTHARAVGLPNARTFCPLERLLSTLGD